MKSICRFLISISVVLSNCVSSFGQYTDFVEIFSCDFDHVKASATPGGMWRGVPLNPELEGESPQKFYSSFDVFDLPEDYVYTTLNGYSIINEMKKNPNDAGAYSHFHYGFKDHTSGNGYMLICKNWEIAFSCKDYNLKIGDKVRFSFYTHELVESVSASGGIYGIFAIASSKRYDIANTPYNGSVCQSGSDEYCTRNYVYNYEDGWEKQTVEYVLNQNDSVYFYFASSLDSYTPGCFDDIRIEIAHAEIFKDAPLNSNFELYKSINFEDVPAVEFNSFSRGAEMDMKTEGTSSNVFSPSFTNKSEETNVYNIIRNLDDSRSKDHTYEGLRELGLDEVSDNGFYFYGTDYQVDCSNSNAKLDDEVYVSFFYNAPVKSNLRVIVEDDNSQILYESEALITNKWEWLNHTFYFSVGKSSNMKMKVVSADGEDVPFALDDISFFMAEQKKAKVSIIVQSNNNMLGSIEGPCYRYFDGTEENLTFTAVPNDSSRFINWSDGEMSQTRTLEKPLSNIKLTANFKKLAKCLSLNVSSNDTTMGVVEFEDKCYDYVTQVEISAKSKENYKFIKWSDGDKNSRRTIILVSDTTITAIFEALPVYTITMNISTFTPIDFYHSDTLYNISADTVMQFQAVKGNRVSFTCRGHDSSVKYSLKYFSEGLKDGNAMNYEFTANESRIVNLHLKPQNMYHIKVESSDEKLGTLYYVSYDYSVYPHKEIRTTEEDVYVSYDNSPLKIPTVESKSGGFAVGYYDEQKATVSQYPYVTSDTVLTYLFAPNYKCALILSSDTTYGHSYLVCSEDTIIDNGVRLVDNNSYLVPNMQQYPRVSYKAFGKAKEGYVLIGFKINGYIQYGDTIQGRTMVGEKVSVVPVFSKIMKSVDLIINDKSLGEVKGLKDSYKYGDTLKIDIIPISNKIIFDSYVSKGNSIDENRESHYECIVSDDLVITVNFEENLYRETPNLNLLSNNGNLGKVVGGGVYKEFEKVDIEAIANKDCLFLGWSDGNKDAKRTYTLGAKDVTLTAYFVRITENTGLAEVIKTYDSEMVNVYTVTGVLIKSYVLDSNALDDLPNGIYVVGNKLRMKRNK